MMSSPHLFYFWSRAGTGDGQPDVWVSPALDRDLLRNRELVRHDYCIADSFTQQLMKYIFSYKPLRF